MSVDPNAALVGRTVASSDGERQRLLNTQIDVVLGDGVLGPVAEETRSSLSDLRERVSVTAVEDSDILLVEGDGPSAEEAQALTSTVALGYRNYSRESEKRALQDQADGLQGPINSVRARLGAVPTAQEGARTALNNQLRDSVGRQEQLRTAAAVFPGQVQVLSAANLAESPSSLTPALGAATGGAVGLSLAGAWLLLRYRRAVRRAFGVVPD